MYEGLLEYVRRFRIDPKYNFTWAHDNILYSNFDIDLAILGAFCTVFAFHGLF